MNEQIEFKGKVAVDKFLEHLRADRKSLNTIKTYSAVLRSLFFYINKELREITIEDLERYKLEGLKDKQKSSVRTFIEIIKEFFKFSGMAEKVANLTLPQASKRLPEVLTQEEAKQLLTVAEDNPRDYAVLTTFLYAGLRKSELINLRISDINFEEGILTVKSGKGDKDRKVPLHNDVVSAIRRYLEYRIKNKLIPIHKENADLLFLGYQRRNISLSIVERIVKEYCARAGITKRISPHTLRHTALSQLYKATKDIRFVQQIAGHARIATTEIYVHTDTDYLKEVYLKAGLSFTAQKPLISYELQEKQKEKKERVYFDYFG